MLPEKLEDHVTKSPKKTYEMVIPSEPGHIQTVERKAEELALQLGFTEDERDSLAIAVTEVVANAILHGNKKIKSKKVFVKFVVSNRTLEIHVRDEGGGFKPEEVADPLQPENLYKDSGRGIFIVKTLMDEVKYHFNKTGTNVILIKHHKTSEP